MRKALLLLVFLAPAAGAQEAAPVPEPLRAAVARGDPEAYLEMGILYEFGYHAPGRKAQALAWYMRAAAQGHVRAAARRDALRARMTAEEIAHAQRLLGEAPKSSTGMPAGAEAVPAPR